MENKIAFSSCLVRVGVNKGDGVLRRCGAMLVCITSSLALSISRVAFGVCNYLWFYMMQPVCKSIEFCLDSGGCFFDHSIEFFF
jgi:hypothetical protein